MENIRATIAKKTIRAPFSGRLGVRLVNLGQTLKAGDAIVSLQALNPIYADFYLPQQELGKISPGMPVRVSCNAFPDRPVEGPITAINPDVDAVTRNVRVQATLANPGRADAPGHVRRRRACSCRQKQSVLIIPATSVLYAPFGDSVFVVEDQKDDKTGEVTKVVRQQIVRLGLQPRRFRGGRFGAEGGRAGGHLRGLQAPQRRAR